MRRILYALAVVVLSSCSPAERFLYSVWAHEDPPAAQDALERSDPALLATDTPALPPELFQALWDVAHASASWSDTDCARWDRMIDAAGLPDHFHTVMRAESQCLPWAHNPSGATGLLQIMPMWADDCGTTLAGLYDPWTNVQCAVHVYAVSGGGAWSTW